MIIVWTIVSLLTFCIGFVVGVRVCRNAYEKKQLLNMMDNTLELIKKTTNKKSKTKEPYQIDFECIRCNRLIGKETYAIVDKVNEVHKIVCGHCIGKEKFKCINLVQVRKGEHE